MSRRSSCEKRSASAGSRSRTISAPAPSLPAYPAPEAAVRALAAGIDLVQIGNPTDAEDVAEAIESAVDRGEISRDRLAQATERVINLKREMGLIDD